MTSEYIKFYHAEKIYGEKNLLLTQAELITIKKHIKNYKKLRKQELMLRIEFKKALTEAKESISLLEKRLPSSDLCKPEEAKPVKIVRTKPEAHLSPMDQEIEEIRQKLAKLQ